MVWADGRLKMNLMNLIILLQAQKQCGYLKKLLNSSQVKGWFVCLLVSLFAVCSLVSLLARLFPVGLLFLCFHETQNLFVFTKLKIHKNRALRARY